MLGARLSRFTSSNQTSGKTSCHHAPAVRASRRGAWKHHCPSTMPELKQSPGNPERSLQHESFGGCRDEEMPSAGGCAALSASPLGRGCVLEKSARLQRPGPTTTRSQAATTADSPRCPPHHTGSFPRRSPPSHQMCRDASPDKRQAAAEPDTACFQGGPTTQPPDRAPTCEDRSLCGRAHPDRKLRAIPRRPRDSSTVQSGAVASPAEKACERR